MPLPYEPSQHNFSVLLRQGNNNTAPIVAGKSNKLEVVISITRKDFPVPKGAAIHIHALYADGSEDVVFDGVTPRVAYYVPENPISGDCRFPIRWTPSHAGAKVKITATDADGVVRGTQFKKIVAG